MTVTLKDITDREEQYTASTYKRFPLLIKRGKGAKCYDENDKEYIDLTSGIGVNVFGFSDGKMIADVTEQLNLLTHTSNLFYTEPQIRAAELITQKANMKKVFFCNSGAEANEAAIKTARKYGHDNFGPEKHEIITLKNSFHGRTMATITATGQEQYHKDFMPFLDGIKYVDASDLQMLKENIGENTVAIMLELIQGEGGVIPIDKSYVKEVEEICKERDILLIIDEVQTGAGRCGAFLCSHIYGLNPDIVTMAKGIGGGLPVGACLFAERTANVLGYGDHGTTFGGSPPVSASVESVLKRLDHKLYEEVKNKGDYIKSFLKQHDETVADVSGLGLMVGFRAKNKSSSEVVKKGIEMGVLALTAKDKVRLLPPLNISIEEIDKGLEILLKACE